MIKNISTELKSHFLRLYQIACSDENFDVLEMKQLYKFAEQRGIEVEQLQNILINPVFRLNIPESINDRIEYLYDLALMIWVDEVINEDEYNTLKKFCKNFGFIDENIIPICDYLLDCAKKEMSLQEVLDNINN